MKFIRNNTRKWNFPHQFYAYIFGTGIPEMLYSFDDEIIKISHQITACFTIIPNESDT